jgi:acyl-CoA reductase-like NAD-dependent aldehyde dehydrogenase
MVNGRVGEQEVIDNLNPFTDEIINSFKEAGIQDVDRAFAAAQEKSKTWSRTNPVGGAEYY